MANQMLGGSNQEWVNRGARERAFARFAGTGFFAVLILAIFEGACLAYVGLHPHYIPYMLAQPRDGSYELWGEAAPNDAGTRKLLADWLANWRIGSSDPRSLPARQTVALISTGSGDTVASQVRAYYQTVLDDGLTVTPTVRTVDVSGNEAEVDWDETVSSGPKASSRSMRAYVTFAYDQAHANRTNDPLLNPFGVYVTKLRVVEVGHAH